MKNISLKFKIQSLIALFTVIFFLSFGIYLYKTEKEKIIKSQDFWMLDEVETLSNFIDIQIEGNQKNVNSAMKVAHHLFYAKGNVIEHPDKKITMEAVNQITKKVHTVTLNAWTLGGTPIHNNFEMVDFIKEMSVETATIFQKIDQGYLRISTNVMKLNGERAVGTFIPNDSPVIKTCESGRTYTGRAYVVNDWYLTAYEPIYINGEIKGILYVGLKEKKLDELRKFFMQNQNFHTSLNYLIEENGNLLIRGGDKIKNLNEKDKLYFKTVLADNRKEGRQEYINEKGIEIVQFFKYNETIKSYIIFDINKEEYDAALNELFWAIIAGGIIITILLLLVNGLILNKLFSNFNKLGIFSKEIAAGNLNYKMQYAKNDEIGSISKSLNQLLKNYKSLVAVIKLISEGKLKEADKVVNNLVKSGGVTNKKENEFYAALLNMISQLNRIVGEIQIGAENIANASLTIKDVSGTLATGANVQASSSEEVSSSMEEMSAIITQTAHHAREADRIAVAAAKGIDDSSLAFKTTTKTMQEIADKIKVIGKIAEKTDVLAINAAIEASHAGEEGKGFAVVAQEIRKLAENTQQAAKEINRAVNVSLSVAKKSEKTLTAIVPEIQKTAKLVQEINLASEEQNLGAQQVNKAIQELTAIIQQNSGSSTIIDEGSKSMSKQAAILEETIAFFNTDFKKTYTKSNESITDTSEDIQTTSSAEIISEDSEIDLNPEFDDNNDDDFERF